MTQPTVVLVHGAFADASSYAPVTSRLLKRGFKVVVPGVPNRSLLGDAAYVASLVRGVGGPVVLVGHSYGGAVITVAGTEENVKALVYLSGYVLEEGESLGELQGGFPGSKLGAALVFTPSPLADYDEKNPDVTVDVEKFPEVVAADVDPDLAAVLASSQRPLAGLAFAEKATAAAWRTKPAWAVVSSSDTTINPDVERFGYRRAGIDFVEIDASHMVMLSHPDEVVDIILQAVEATK
ncbi:alpha/beta hydrolase family protein [Streptomyces sp. NPDC048342]|uniref:alpha/beta hydrolase n=1 Tax=unclassified Streptomyces TaxID=2593676 RepID=UPI00342CAFBC